jgi:hypothetical protein
MAVAAPLLIDALPEFAEELRQLLLQKNETVLAAQIGELRIVELCRCREEFCSSFYTQPRPEKAYPPDSSHVELQPRTGMLLLDIVRGRIAHVEVLFRDDVRKKLAELKLSASSG